MIECVSKKDLLKRFFSDVSNFRIIYIVQIMFLFVAFLDTVSVVTSVITMIWGAYLLVRKGFVARRLLTIKFFPVVALFIVSNVVTMIMQIKNNFIINFVYVFYTVLVFIFFYGMLSYSSFEKIKRELLIVFKCIIWINTILILLSLIMLFVVPICIDPYGYELGIYKSERLTGIYMNPNFLGFCATVTIIMNFTLFKKKNDCDKKKLILPLWFSIVSIAINMLGLFLCDSNASFLFLLIYIIAFVFFKVCVVMFKFNVVKILSSFLLLLLFCVGLMVGYFTIRKTCQSFMNSTVNKVYEDADIDNEYSSENKGLKGKISIGRRLGLSNYKDISNGRIDLLKQGIKMFLRHPVMGIGRGNLEYYGNLYFENGLKFSDLHNGYLTVLVASGAVGFILFSVWGICVIQKLLSCIFESRKNKVDLIFYHLVATLCGYCVYSFVEKTILTEMTFMTIFFWMILGYSMSYALKFSKERILGDD